MKNKLNRLIEIAESSGAFKTGEFLLSSGKKVIFILMEG